MIKIGLKTIKEGSIYKIYLKLFLSISLSRIVTSDEIEKR